MTEEDARAALRAQGIRNPSKALIENWLRVQQCEEAASPPPAPWETVGDMQPCISPSLSLEDAPSAGRQSSESNLEPLLRERGELQRPGGRRKAGRPRVQAPWFQALATLMADGSISLRRHPTRPDERLFNSNHPPANRRRQSHRKIFLRLRNGRTHKFYGPKQPRHKLQIQ